MTHLSPQERAEAYNNKFPKWARLSVHNNKIYGLWLVGALYRKRVGYYGEFPHTIQKRILALFPDCKTILWLFSGVIEKPRGFRSITYDINPEVKPDICDDVRNLKKYDFTDVDLVIADPPYEREDFEKYGLKPIDKAQVIRDLWSVTKCPCYLAWLDLRVPMVNKMTWRMTGLIGVVVAMNTRVRCLSIWTRLEPKILPASYDPPIYQSRYKRSILKQSKLDKFL